MSLGEERKYTGERDSGRLFELSIRRAGKDLGHPAECVAEVEPLDSIVRDTSIVDRIGRCLGEQFRKWSVVGPTVVIPTPMTLARVMQPWV